MRKGGKYIFGKKKTAINILLNTGMYCFIKTRIKWIKSKYSKTTKKLGLRK